MKLVEMFKKPVDRAIEGVIKADDVDGLFLEVDEYVLTDEIARKIELFLGAYLNYSGANGVWISGFFGSGKSHLLKMLSMMLENRSIDGKKVVDLFLLKTDNEILKADLKRAATVPSKSILFNIDQKADVISKGELDALLSVFMKVFDESCGYYGKQGHIAKFERDLDERNQLSQFKEKYEEVAGKIWDRGREQAVLEKNNISKAYAKLTGGKPEDYSGLLDNYRKDYRVSIEDFAEQINHYISKQDKNFRLNFFVDEVGQYIADNIKLMTNLQTIAESLATKSKGRAWIVVTAQEEMTSIVGEMNKQQGNDFSKIQARFSNRLKLTSQDVAEVIQKRLLAKTDAATRELQKIYSDQKNNFKTLFDFSDSRVYSGFKNQDHFVQSFPFIPYQFDLFQEVIQSLSLHNSFEGKHSSVGERSMLAVFQEVAKVLVKGDDRELATFDLMFEGIRNTLKAQIQSAILQAEKSLPNQFALKVLKVLFLVKYVKGFKATPRNILVLLINSFDADLSKLKSDIEGALALLEQQTYIQRSGDIYEFLTDEEKDIEREIKETDLNNSDIGDQIQECIFEQILRDSKIRLGSNGPDYRFAKKLDDRLLGRDSELAIHVISPLHEHSANETVLIAQSMGRNELVVVLSQDDRVIRDIATYLRTEKYYNHHFSTTQRESHRRILQDRYSQNSERLSDIRKQIANLVVHAVLLVNGTKIDITSQDPAARIKQAFQSLIIRTYENLGMLKNVTYLESMIGDILEKRGSVLASDPDEAENEVLGFLKTNKSMSKRSTLKEIGDRFEKKPYGWQYPAPQCVIAKLIARGKVDVFHNSNLVDYSQVVRLLKNSADSASVIVEPQMDYSPSQVRMLKEFYQEFFNEPVSSSDAPSISKEINREFSLLFDKINARLNDIKRYPFLVELKPLAAISKTYSDANVGNMVELLGNQKSTLFDLKESILDPIEKMLNGPQRDIYDEALDLVVQESQNIKELNSEVPVQIQKTLGDPFCYRGNTLTKLKDLTSQLRDLLNNQISFERNEALSTIRKGKKALEDMPEFSKLDGDAKRDLQDKIDRLIRAIEVESHLLSIRATAIDFAHRKYPSYVAAIANWKVSADASKNGLLNSAEAQRIHTPIRAIKSKYPRQYLENESDVGQYVSDLKEVLIEQVRKGHLVVVGDL